MDPSRFKPQSEPSRQPNQGAVMAAWIALAIPVVLVYLAALCWFGPLVCMVVICFFEFLALLCLLPLLPFVWAWCFTRAPELTKTATLIGVLGFVLLSVTACWVVRSREAARRNDAANKLRELGGTISEMNQFDPGDPQRRRQR